MVKTFAQTHARGERFRRVPKPKDPIQEAIGPWMDKIAGFFFFHPVAFLMKNGFPEMPAKIVWLGVLYVLGKIFEEYIWKSLRGKTKKKVRPKSYAAGSISAAKEKRPRGNIEKGASGASGKAKNRKKNAK